MDLETAKKEFGLRVKSYRNSRNLTQEQFCSLTDLEQANLSNIENGKSSNSVKYDTIDYEIMNILVTLSEPAKKNIKNILEMINKNYS